MLRRDEEEEEALSDEEVEEEEVERQEGPQNVERNKQKSSMAGVCLNKSGEAFMYRSDETDKKYAKTRGAEWAVRSAPLVTSPSPARLCFAVLILSVRCAQAFQLYVTEVAGYTHDWLEKWVWQDKEKRVVHNDEPLQLWVQWLDDQNNMDSNKMERCLRWAQVTRAPLNLTVAPLPRSTRPRHRLRTLTRAAHSAHPLPEVCTP